MKNGIHETTTTTGTGTITLSAVTGRVRFSQAFAVGLIVPYAINDGNNWEWGWGTVASGNTLERSKIVATLVAGTYDDTTPTANTLSGGSAQVYCTDVMGFASPGMAFVGAPVPGDRKAIYSAHHAGAPTGTLTLVANRLYIIPFKLDTAAKVNGFVFDMATNAAGSKARLCLYQLNASDASPTVIITETADVDVSVTANVLNPSTTAVMLAPGWYGIGLLSDGAPSLVSVGTGAALMQAPWGLDGAAGSCLAVNMLTKTITAGWTSMPATPTGLAHYLAGSQAMPAIALSLT